MRKKIRIRQKIEKRQKITIGPHRIITRPTKTIGGELKALLKIIESLDGFSYAGHHIDEDWARFDYWVGKSKHPTRISIMEIR